MTTTFEDAQSAHENSPEYRRTKRLISTIHKLTKWSGVEIPELIEDGYLHEGDLDQ